MSAQPYSRADRARVARRVTPRCLCAVDIDRLIARARSGDASWSPWLFPLTRHQNVIPGTASTGWRRAVSFHGRLYDGPDGPIDREPCRLVAINCASAASTPAITSCDDWAGDHLDLVERDRIRATWVAIARSPASGNDPECRCGHAYSSHPVNAPDGTPYAEGAGECVDACDDGTDCACEAFDQAPGVSPELTAT